MPLANVLQPREFDPQIVSICLEVEGYGIIQPSQLINGITWEDDLETGAKITITLPNNANPFGTEINWKGPPPGTRNITLWSMYVIDDVPTWKKIISGAISDSSSREINGTTREITIEILGYLFRHQTKKISYVLPVGHRNSPEQMIKDILDLLDIPNGGIIAGSSEKVKPVQISCEEGLDKAREIANSMNKVIYYDAENGIALLPNGFYDSPVTTALFTELDLLYTEGIRIDAVGGEVATSVLVTGELATSEPCSEVIVTTRLEETTPYAMNNPGFGRGTSAPNQQNSSGVVSSTSASDTTVDFITKRTIKDVCTSCNKALWEREREYGWHNPKTWRYKLNTAGVPVDWNTGYINDNPATANSELYTQAYETFELLSDTLTIHDYAAGQGVLVDTLGNGAHYDFPPNGANHEDRVFYGGWYLYETALKQLTDFDISWENTPYIANVMVTGGGVGVAAAGSTGEQYIGYNIFFILNTFVTTLADHETVVYIGESDSLRTYDSGGDMLAYEQVNKTINDGGYITKDRTARYETGKSLGKDYYFSDGIVSDQQNARTVDRVIGSEVSYYDAHFDFAALVKSNTTNTYFASESTGLTTITSVKDYLTAGFPTKTTREISNGYLPEALLDLQESEKLTTQAFEFVVSAPILLISHVEKEGSVSNTYIETEAEAEALAISYIRENSALGVQSAVIFNTDLKPGKVVRCYVRREGVNELVYIRNVKGSWNGLGSPIITQFSGRIYVV
jgi:hypothetical protein